MNIQNCNPLDQLLIEKIGFSKETVEDIRENVNSGQNYKIDRLLHVTGELKVGEDYSTTPTVHIPVKATLALLARRLGFQRDDALQLIRECVTEAILNEQKAADLIPVIEKMEKQIQADVIKKLPKVWRKGLVNTKSLTVTRVTAREIRPYRLREKAAKVI